MRRALIPSILITALLLAAQVAHVHAQAAGRVTVVRIDPSADPISRSVETAVAEFGVAPDPGYFNEAGRRGLDPISEEALVSLVPLIGAELALVPRGLSPVNLELEYRDGRSGQSLGVVNIPLANGMLAWTGRKMLVAQTRTRLGGAGQAAPGNLPPSGPGSGPTGADGYRDDGGEDGDADGEDADAEDDAIDAHLAVGVGIGTRSIEWPVEGETDVVDLGTFAAVEIRSALDIVLSKSFSIGPAFTYQTSLNHEVTEQHVAGEPHTMSIRAHRFEGLIVPTLRFGEHGNVALWAGVGYGVRDLSPDVHHLLVPSYSISGPLLRLGLQVVLVERALALTLEPEAQWIVQIGDDLRERGVGASGSSIGGQGALAVELGDRFSLALTYRQVHGTLGAGARGDASDVERFVTVRLGREL